MENEKKLMFFRNKTTTKTWGLFWAMCIVFYLAWVLNITDMGATINVFKMAVNLLCVTVLLIVLFAIWHRGSYQIIYLGKRSIIFLCPFEIKRIKLGNIVSLGGKLEDFEVKIEYADYKDKHNPINRNFYFPLVGIKYNFEAYQSLFLRLKDNMYDYQCYEYYKQFTELSTEHMIKQLDTYLEYPRHKMSMYYWYFLKRAKYYLVLIIINIIVLFNPGNIPKDLYGNILFLGFFIELVLNKVFNMMTNGYANDSIKIMKKNYKITLITRICFVVLSLGIGIKHIIPIEPKSIYLMLNFTIFYIAVFYINIVMFFQRFWNWFGKKN